MNVTDTEDMNRTATKNPAERQAAADRLAAAQAAVAAVEHICAIDPRTSAHDIHRRAVAYRELIDAEAALRRVG